MQNRWTLKVALFAGICLTFFSCKKELIEEMNNYEFKGKLSEYSIYKKDLKDLSPEPEFHLYELSSQLFTDYAKNNV